MLLTKIEYKFDSDPVKINENGHMVDADKLVLHAPKIKDLPIISKLKQLISCADLQRIKMLGGDVINAVSNMNEVEKADTIAKEKESKEQEEEGNKNPSGILANLYSSEIDIQKVFELFDNLTLNTGNITVNDAKTNFNSAMRSQLTPNQYEAIVDLYLSAFM